MCIFKMKITKYFCAMNKMKMMDISKVMDSSVPKANQQHTNRRKESQQISKTNTMAMVNINHMKAFSKECMDTYGIWNGGYT